MNIILPPDLDDLSRFEALDAVAADIRDHPLTPDADGFGTAARHAELISHLLVRFLGDAAFHFDDAHDPDAPECDSGPLTAAAAQLGEALCHYTRAAVPLASLAASRPATLSQRLDGVERFATVTRQLHAGRQALARARTALAGQPNPRATAPSPPANQAPPAPRTRH